MNNKKIAFSAFFSFMFIAGTVSAMELNEYKLKDLKAAQAEPVVATAATAPVFVPGSALVFDIKNETLHLMPAAKGHSISSTARTKEDFEAFTNKWLPVLEKNGLKAVKIKYDEKIKFGYIEYSSDKNLVIRDFIADSMDYDAKNQESINLAKIQVYDALGKAGLETVAMLNLDTDIFRPTFRYYYLTQYNENEDREIAVRQLNLGYEDELPVVADHLNIIRVDRGEQVFHIGPRMNYKWKLGIDEKDMQESIEKYKKFLKEKGLRFVNLKTRRLEKPVHFIDKDYNFVTDIYFFL